MKKIIYIMAFSLLIFQSCKKDEVAGGTAVQDMSGEWWVQIDGEGAYYSLITYNTSDNSSTQMWLDASGFWAGTNQHVSAKINVDLANMTFSVKDAPNVGAYPTPLSMTITDGKILKNATVGPVSKSVTDSIYLDIVFSDDAGTHYKLSGYHRTKFPGDDH